MYSEIKLNNIGFHLKVTAMEVAGHNMEDNVNIPEVTGNMKTLQKYLESYSELLQMLNLYKTLIEEDVRQLRKAQKAIVSVESQLLK